jgi:hypothetical protein
VEYGGVIPLLLVMGGVSAASQDRCAMPHLKMGVPAMAERAIVVRVREKEGRGWSSRSGGGASRRSECHNEEERRKIEGMVMMYLTCGP